jgi:uncharacterized membrane protein
MRILFTAGTTTQYRWLAVLWTAAILGGLSLPPSSLSPAQTLLSFDKLIHAVLFGVFGLLWMRVLCPPDAAGEASLRWRGGQLLGMGVLFAGGTEVYQQIIPVRRMSDPYDALADAVGLLIGILLYGLLVRYGDADSSTASASRES